MDKRWHLPRQLGKLWRPWHSSGREGPKKRRETGFSGADLQLGSLCSSEMDRIQAEGQHLGVRKVRSPGSSHPVWSAQFVERGWLYRTWLEHLPMACLVTWTVFGCDQEAKRQSEGRDSPNQNYVQMPLASVLVDHLMPGVDLLTQLALTQLKWNALCGSGGFESRQPEAAPEQFPSSEARRGGISSAGFGLGCPDTKSANPPGHGIKTHYLDI